MLRVATAFSGGFGSVEMAMKYENIDHEVVFAIEWMDAQRESYLLNHGKPTGEFGKDICDFDGTKYRGEIDYYHLSPPCTQYSMAGKREGLAGESGKLMFEAIKSIAEVQSLLFTIENVAGLLSSNNGDDFRNIMRDLRKHLPNYTIQYGKLNASDMGTPQNRLRVFIIGFRADVPEMPFPASVPLEKTLRDVQDDDVPTKYYLSQKMLDGFVLHKERHDARGNGFGFKPLDEDATVSKAITTKHGTRATDGYLLNQIGNIDPSGENRQATRVYDTQIATTQSANGGGHGAKGGLYAVAQRGRYHGEKTQQHIEVGEKNVANAITTVQKDSMVATPLRVKSATNKGYEEANVGDGINIGRPTSTTRRGRVQKSIAPTITTQSEVGVIEINGDNFNVRRLTPREAARCFGDFEDRFKMGDASDTKLYEYIGNSIDINTMRRLITAMLRHIDGVKLNPIEVVKFEKAKVQCSLFEEIE